MEFDCLNWSHNLSLLTFAVSLLTVILDERHTVVPGLCSQELEARVLTLDSGHWTVDAGLCTLNRHTRIPGIWTQELDAGLWVRYAGL